MSPMDNIHEKSNILYFLDQKNGIIHSYNHDSEETYTIFDMDSSEIPSGLTLDWPHISSGQTYRVKSMTEGSSPNEIIAVFTSSTLPTGWKEANAKLPAPNAVEKWVCGPNTDNIAYIEDIYRPSAVPDCASMGGGTPIFLLYD
eukprot:15215163-Ditylum_brightwellii.AAC.1